MNRHWSDKDLIRVINLAGFSTHDANDEKLMAIADECLSRHNIYTEAADDLLQILKGEAIFK